METDASVPFSFPFFLKQPFSFVPNICNVFFKKKERWPAALVSSAFESLNGDINTYLQLTALRAMNGKLLCYLIERQLYRIVFGAIMLIFFSPASDAKWVDVCEILYYIKYYKYYMYMYMCVCIYIQYIYIYMKCSLLGSLSCL